MNDTVTKIIRPDWLQFMIDKLHLFVLLVVCALLRIGGGVFGGFSDGGLHIAGCLFRVRIDLPVVLPIYHNR